MGKYDNVSRCLITHCDELFPFAFMDQPRDWKKIDEILQNIPFECERVLTAEELLFLYD